jgi:hypothetical protein
VLASRQRGPSVRGALDVARAGAGGRLEVTLFAKRASLAKALPSARVGRFVRSSVRAGVVHFDVPLLARGRSALRRHRRLSLTARIVLTPVSGTAVTLTRSVVLHS